jgi:putative Holliday junction resolvase
MVYGLLKEIIADCPPKSRLLGLDIGKKTIGLAISDGGQSLATPLLTIERKKFSKDMIALSKVISDYEVHGFIAGLPINMDGSKGAACDRIESFVDEMHRFLTEELGLAQDIWIALWDERLSTVSVEDHVDEFVEKRKTRINAKASGLIDKLAAQVILQSALDYMAHSRSA